MSKFYIDFTFQKISLHVNNKIQYGNQKLVQKTLWKEIAETNRKVRPFLNVNVKG